MTDIGDDFDERDRPARIRWGWVVVWLVAGALVSASAFFVPAGWHEDSPGLLINIGTALGMAGVLLWLERLFTARVVKANREAVRQVATELASEVEQRIDQRTEVLAVRLEDLQSQVRDRLRREAREQDSAVDAVAENVNHRTVLELFSQAGALNAVLLGRVTVPGGPPPDAAWVTFGYGSYLKGVADRLHIEARRRGHRGRARLSWAPEESATEVGTALVRELSRNGLWDGTETLDWGQALRNLHRAVTVAVASRRRDQGAPHLTEPLIEWLDDDWMITWAGLECPAQQRVVTRTDLRRHEAGVSAADRLAPPGDMPAEVWDHYLYRAIDQLTLPAAGLGWRPGHPPR